MPEAILTIQSHIPIREVLMKTNSIQYLEFLGNAFDKVQCPCINLQVIHTNAPFSTNGMKVNDGKRLYTISNKRDITPESFSVLADDLEYLVLEKIANIPNKTTLKGHATFALGIVTGNNKKYISKTKQNKYEIVLKGANLYKYRFNKPENYILFEPESFQQVASIDLYRAPEKLLYRFISTQLVFSYDDNQTLSLNSCNLLIPSIKGLDIKYIMAILNSRISQFFFKKQFNSIKVLKSHIEQIPIPVIDSEIQSQFIDIVNKLIKSNNNSEIFKLYDELDIMISNLYGLTKDEYKIIKASVDSENKFLV